MATPLALVLLRAFREAWVWIIECHADWFLLSGNPAESGSTGVSLSVRAVGIVRIAGREAAVKQYAAQPRCALAIASSILVVESCMNICNDVDWGTKVILCGILCACIGLQLWPLQATTDVVACRCEASWRIV